MTIIKDWRPSPNSREWEKVVEDADGPNEQPMEPGRLFMLTRRLTNGEWEPLDDMETACACELHYNGSLLLYADQPLVKIVHHYLDSLGD